MASLAILLVARLDIHREQFFKMAHWAFTSDWVYQTWRAADLPFHLRRVDLTHLQGREIRSAH